MKISKIKKMMKKAKGFTLVELIVVLVILAILAAIMVPALLGYIEKAREKQITTDANAALTASQALADEAYGTYDGEKDTRDDALKADNIKELADIDADFTVTATWGEGTAADKDYYKIKTYTYTESSVKKKAEWDGSKWTVSNVTTTP